MSFIQKIFGKSNSTTKQTNQSVSQEVLELRVKSEEKMKLLECLTASGAFNQARMANYISIFEKYNGQMDSEKQYQILHANELTDVSHMFSNINSQ